ncbi:MAG: trypsin-like peptidase domain-containing protein [Candidatus Zixiibacteriota bacterium]
MRFMRILFIAVFMLSVSSTLVQAQLSLGGTPYSFENPLKSSIDTKIMSAVNINALEAEDAVDSDKGLPFRFGAPFDVDYDLYNSGTWEELPDGAGIWRLKIVSDGAFSINLVYNQFYMPSGARLFVYNETRDMVIGAFSEQNNKEHKKFATAPIKGDAIILEYFEPADVRGTGFITVSRIVHAYKDIFNYGGTKYDKGFGSSGSCNNNINCPEGDPWQAEKRGVAMVLLSGGTRWCSGSLINNVREDQTPYFLTADHCLGSEETWILMFNYESPNCANINGPTYYTVQGTTLKASNSYSDFGLLELEETPPDSFNIYFNGWNNLDVASTSSVTIHHPSGDIKKISFDNDPVTSTEYLQTATGYSHWRIGQWEDGTTEGGSSGSPLFDPYHRIVGQLHGGYASCTSITSDWYGKFAKSWNYGGSPSNRIKDWLDPDNTGATVLDGLDPFGAVSINHVPLPNTKDTINDYEVRAIIKSKDPLVADSLKLFYEIASVWYDEFMVVTGNPDEFHAYIPAQSPGTSISYYIIAWDEAETSDTAGTYTFNVEYSPAISINPLLFNHTLNLKDSTMDMLIIENSGEGELNYSVDLEINPYWKSYFDKLLTNGEVESATRIYPDTYINYIENKGEELFLPGFSVDKDAGGPDTFGYFWIDSDEPGGPEYNWIEISGTGSNISAGIDDDNWIGPFTLGFDFPYYDNIYNEFYVGSNGIIGFDTTYMKGRTETTLPDTAIPNNILAWMWDDLDITDSDNPGGRVYYQYDAEKCIIEFSQYPEYGANPGDVITAQVIIYAEGDIKFQYEFIASGFDLTSSTVGIENSDGTDGLEVAFHTIYLHDHLAILFARPFQWLTTAKSSGTIASLEADTIVCWFKSGELDTGIYYASFTVTSNDPDPGDDIISIPIEMTVIEEGPSYICGDANNDEAVNILDITYIIAYLYKDGPAPDPLARADCNGTVDINILDITYLIAFLYKGGPDPICGT